MSLGWVGSSIEKNNLHEVRSIESNFRSIEPCRFRLINPAITQFQLLQINTLWASINLESMFWSWFANIIHNEVLIHLVPKVLEHNNFHSFCFCILCIFFLFKHIMHGHIRERKREREREEIPNYVSLTS